MKEVHGWGPMNARIVAVGEAPGGMEEAQGRPFVGPAGDLLKKELLGVGIDHEDVRFENVSYIRPPDNDMYTFFSQDELGIPNDHVIRGLEKLASQLSTIKDNGGANVVVALGNYPMWALTQGLARWNYDDKQKHWRMMGIKDHRGNIHPCKLDTRIKVINTFHPSYILQQGRFDSGLFVTDLSRVREDSLFPELRYPHQDLWLDLRDQLNTPKPHAGETIHRIHDSDMPWIEERLMDQSRGLLTFDIEYVGKLLCIGFSDARDWAVSIRADRPGAMDLFRRVLLSGRPLNAQNSMYEDSILEWFYEMEVIKHIKYDTMLAAHAANPELPKDLGTLESIYTRVPNHKFMVDWKKIKKGEQSIDTVIHYNSLDCVTQHEICEEQQVFDLNDPMVRSVAEFELALNPILWSVSKRGIRIDKEKMNKLRKKTQEELEGHLAVLKVMAGEEINVNSPDQVGKLFFGRLGIPTRSVGKTPGGKWKTDDKTFADIFPTLVHEVHIDCMKAYRQAKKANSLLSKFVDVEMDEDGRSRGMYSPAGTVSGRLASKKFWPTGKGHQQQNIPRNKTVRSVFIPDDGKGYGYFDLERAESLCVAHICNDPLMLQHHQPDVDAHRLLGAIIFDMAPELLNDDQRYIGKQTRHAGNYMEGPRTMMLNVNKYANETGVWVTEDQCKGWIRTYRDIHTNLQPWWYEVKSDLYRTHIVKNMLGWPRQFFGHVESILPEAVAQNPQSTVGHVLNIGVCMLHGVVLDYFRKRMTTPEREVIAISEYLRYDCGFEMLQQVHDAVGFQYNLGSEAGIAWGVSKLMEVRLQNPRTYDDFIIPVEAAVGISWGEVKKLKTISEPPEWRNRLVS